MAKVLSASPAMTIKNRYFCNDDDVSLDSWQSNTVNSNDNLSNPSDLVSLAWLQKGDIIQIAPLDGEEDNEPNAPSCTTSFPPVKLDGPPVINNCLIKDDNAAAQPFPISISLPSSISNVNGFSSPVSIDCYLHKTNPEPSFSNHLTPSPNTHVLSKPSYSYTHLIFMAIESTPQKCMTVNQIYNWCESNFPFYKHAGAGWKNSLRHNLSINKSFKRLPRDTRGPGRGAFWTVEPRERQTLLEALKRNPWNFSALITGQSDINIHSPLAFGDLYAPQLVGLRRLGFAHSAHPNILRKANLSDLRVDAFGNVFPTSYSTVENPPAVTGAVSIESGEPHFVNQFMPSMDFDSTILSTGDNDLEQMDTPSASDRISVPNEWTVEDEEKYLCSLRCLSESLNVPAVSPQSNVDDPKRSNESPPANESVDKKLSGTKHRRKSRLEPTRTISCSECKENATGCESCHSQSYDPLDNSPFDDRVVIDVGNALDSDQEHGPAGGPAVRKAFPRSTNSDSTSTDVATSIKEVYVTPAPYIDHEYSHCQAQLRGPEDNRMVNRYNEAYFMSAVQRLNRYRLNVKRRLRGRGNRHAAPVEHKPDPSDSENSNVTEPELWSDNEESDLKLKHTQQNRADLGRPRKRGRYRRMRGLSRRRVANNVSERPRILKRDPHIASKRMSFGSSRRSNRVIKAPRRLYDDDSILLNENEASSESVTGDSTGNEERIFSKSVKVVGGRGGRQGRRGRKRGAYGRPYGRRSVHSESDQDFRSESSEDDEEARFLRLAYERQRMQYRYDEASMEESPQASLPVFNVGAAWSHSRMMLERQHNRISWDRSWDQASATEETFIAEDDSMCEVEEVVESVIAGDQDSPNNLGDRELSNTAQPDGASQIERFRRQSGYVSLDSSGTSAELSEDASPCKS